MTVTVENPSKVAIENNDLPIVTYNGGIPRSREYSNNHYAQQAIDKEAAEAAKLDPKNFPLTRFQFSVALNEMGKSMDDLRAAINGAIPAGVQRSVALAAIENPPGDAYNRDNPLFSNDDILTALGLDAATVDATWMAVKDIQSV